MNIWLYHINPKSPAGWTYGWDVDSPRTLLASTDRTWPAGVMFNIVRPGDMICVFMKNIKGRFDGVYVVGNIQKVKVKDGTWFSWAIDRQKSAKLLVSPISKVTVRRLFGRSYGGAMQRLAKEHHRTWLYRLDRAG